MYKTIKSLKIIHNMIIILCTILTTDRNFIESMKLFLGLFLFSLGLIFFFNLLFVDTNLKLIF